MTPTAHNKIDYGIDAPGIRTGMMLMAITGLTLIGITYVGGGSWLKNAQTVSAILSIVGSILFLYGAWMAIYMTYSSRIGKLKRRDHLLEALGKTIEWKQVKRVLDVGCGKGLLLIGAAKRLHTGMAIGIDIWNQQDQSNNQASATLHNAELEAVADKVQLQTADARDLPFENGSIDIVLSNWVVHNIATAREQTRALDEMWRVLRPGGTIVLADIQQVPNYLHHFKTLGATNIAYDDGGWEAKIMTILSGGTYVPQSLICVKPAASAGTSMLTTQPY